MQKSLKMQSIKSKIQNQYSNTVMDAMATEVLLTPTLTGEQ